MPGINISAIGSRSNFFLDILRKKMLLPNQLQINESGLTDCYAVRKNRIKTVQEIQEVSPGVRRSVFVDMPPYFSLTQGNQDDAKKSVLVIAAKDLTEYDAILTSLRNRDEAFKNKFDEEIALNLKSDEVGDEEFQFFLPEAKKHTMISLNSGSLGREASIAQHLMNILEDLAEDEHAEEAKIAEVAEIFQRDPALAQFAEDMTEKFGGMRFN